MKYLFAIVFSLSIAFAYGQNSYSSIKRIDSIVRHIDTVRIFGSMITDGGIQRKNEKRLSGGFSDSYKFIGDSSEKQLLKVDRIASLDYADYSAYYFCHGSLIYVTIERHSRKGNENKTIASGKYYFQNEALIYKVEKGVPIEKPGAFLQQAKFFLENFNNE